LLTPRSGIGANQSFDLKKAGAKSLKGKRRGKITIVTKNKGKNAKQPMKNG
jgi:hypothetical protein